MSIALNKEERKLRNAKLAFEYTFGVASRDYPSYQTLANRYGLSIGTPFQVLSPKLEQLRELRRKAEEMGFGEEAHAIVWDEIVKLFGIETKEEIL